MQLSPDVFRSLCRARQLLADDEDAPSIREVARLVELSPFRLIRQFDALFGVTPHQFRIRERTERAKRLLRASELSVTEVCFEVGFSSLGSFSRLFAERVGSSPSEFRRRCRLIAQVPEMLITPRMYGCFDQMTLLPSSAFAISEKRGGLPVPNTGACESS